jgi:hypothetical protein
MSDLFTALQNYNKAQETNRPTRGVVKLIDGNHVNVLVRGSSTILRHVKAVGAAQAIGQEVVLTWENGIPTAHIVGESAAPSSLVSLSRGPQGPQGPAGETGPQGPAGADGATGSVEAATTLSLIEQSATPATPPAGALLVYAKDDHKVYRQNSDGTEEEIGTGAAGGGGDADTLDGYQASDFALVDHFHTYSYVNVLGSHALSIAIPGNTTNYMAPFIGGLQTVNYMTPWPVDGTLKKLYVRQAGTTQPSDGPLVVTIYAGTNGATLVDTGITITIPAGSPANTDFSDDVHTFEFSAGDYIQVRLENQSASDSAKLGGVTFELESTVDSGTASRDADTLDGYHADDFAPADQSGSAVMADNYIITSSDVWEDTGLSVYLPSAGKYELHVDVRGAIRAAFTPGSAWIAIMFHDDTASIDVANSERMVVLTGTSNMQFQMTAPIYKQVTVDGPTTISLRVKRSCSDSGVTWTTSLLGSNDAGRTEIAFKRIA